MGSAKALVLTGYGINCEQESKYAFEKSGGIADIMHINSVIENPKILDGYGLLFFPGGFSFGDDLGSGKVLANKLKYKLYDPIKDFVNSKKLVIGVCNGFQVLVKLGVLPKPDFVQRATLSGNDSGKFEDRWVFLKVNQQSPCLFTTGMDYLLLPVRHGEGKFIAPEPVLNEIRGKNLVALQYVDRHGKPAGYPYNPNGSVENIAGICDETGGIFGLMPHPEAFNMPQNCPYWPLGGVKEAMGLRIFKNAVKYLTETF
ncbi:phosphoribosylformylglycinamidine synthase subunit PurQ [Candidatus Micrarchaeota archaeon]|nr:phosphoribosylformylglycinamidine synthase subunit PurQ [Candidatus Micrarchaeota archaeon]